MPKKYLLIIVTAALLLLTAIPAMADQPGRYQIAIAAGQEKCKDPAPLYVLDTKTGRLWGLRRYYTPSPPDSFHDVMHPVPYMSVPQFPQPVEERLKRVYQFDFKLSLEPK